jgi:hypothetical protein
MLSRFNRATRADEPVTQ